MAQQDGYADYGKRSRGRPQQSDAPKAKGIGPAPYEGVPHKEDPASLKRSQNYVEYPDSKKGDGEKSKHSSAV